MIEQQQVLAGKQQRAWGTHAHCIALAIFLIVFVGFDASGIGKRTQANWAQLRYRQKRRLEGAATGEDGNIPDSGELGDERNIVNDAIAAVPDDPKTLTAIVAAIILVPATILGAMFSGMVFKDTFIHEIPSTIQYTLPTSVSLRDLSDTEQNDLKTATTSFYDSVLRAAHSEVVSVNVRSFRDADSTAASNILESFFDLFFGAGYHGYQWKFVIVIGTTSTTSLTLGQAVVTVEGASMSEYVSSHLANLGSSNIMANTESTAYLSRL
ncbi:expressed unknown protein [Seminavis robusta]|uniref:Uncharacterized protein n=1 Tax=Seminavis robusta TaxID=568900 RepID=A0A9N8HCB6_9STRA|nr:expressed unknown protein [Seminavis robusta]|eukprot:Sro295_g110390.1 n/a (268) ;mRNA; r:20516-21319